MFSLQNQNQAFATLSQFSGKIATRPILYLKKKSPEKRKQPTNVLCLDSFLETIKNCDFSFATHLNTSTLFETPYLNNFRASFISNESFFENKHGFSEQELNNNVPTLVLLKNRPLQVPSGFYYKFVNGLLHENSFSFNIQLRGFKTDRSIKADIQRNPPITNRVKNAIGLLHTDPGDSKITGANATNTEKLKQMLTNDDTLNESEKQKIKIAFAEGYLLGNSGSRGSKTTRYFRAFTQIVTVFIFLAIIISLLASASGSVFRFGFC